MGLIKARGDTSGLNSVIGKEIWQGEIKVAGYDMKSDFRVSQHYPIFSSPLTITTAILCKRDCLEMDIALAPTYMDCGSVLSERNNKRKRKTKTKTKKQEK